MSAAAIVKKNDTCMTYEAAPTILFVMALRDSSGFPRACVNVINRGYEELKKLLGTTMSRVTRTLSVVFYIAMDAFARQAVRGSD